MTTKLFNFTSERTNALRKREEKNNKEDLETQKKQEEKWNKFYDRESQWYLGLLKSELGSKYLPYVFNKDRLLNNSKRYYYYYGREFINDLIEEPCQNIKENFDKTLRTQGLREFKLDIIDEIRCKIDINTIP